jgi:hypothetical protein
MPAGGRVFELSRQQWQEGFGCLHRFRPRPGGEISWSVAPIFQLSGGGCPAWHIDITNPSIKQCTVDRTDYSGWFFRGTGYLRRLTNTAEVKIARGAAHRLERRRRAHRPGPDEERRSCAGRARSNPRRPPPRQAERSPKTPVQRTARQCVKQLSGTGQHIWY